MIQPHGRDGVGGFGRAKLLFERRTGGGEGGETRGNARTMGGGATSAKVEDLKKEGFRLGEATVGCFTPDMLKMELGLTNVRKGLSTWTYHCSLSRLAAADAGGSFGFEFFILEVRGSKSGSILTAVNDPISTKRGTGLTRTR